jgi:AcrR family transcriptional regulator
LLTASQLDALRELTRVSPWHEITLDDLAAAVGVSRMTLHRHGDSKETALGQLRELLIADHRAAALQALTAEGVASVRMEMALRGVCDVDERYLALIDSLSEDLGVVFHEEGDGPVLTRSAFTDALRRILIDGQQDGTLRSADPTEDATLLFNAAGWTYRHLRRGHHWTPEHAGDRVVELLMRGVIGAGS